MSGGCIVSGSELHNSLLCEEVHIHSYGRIDHGVVLPFVDVGRGVRLSKVIVDVGEDPDADAARFRRTEGGVCLITQRMIDRLVA